MARGTRPDPITCPALIAIVLNGNRFTDELACAERNPASELDDMQRLVAFRAQFKVGHFMIFAFGDAISWRRGTDGAQFNRAAHAAIRICRNASIPLLDPRVCYRRGRFRGLHCDASDESKACVTSTVTRALNIMKFLGLLTLGQMAHIGTMGQHVAPAFGPHPGERGATTVIAAGDRPHTDTTTTADMRRG